MAALRSARTAVRHLLEQFQVRVRRSFHLRCIGHGGLHPVLTAEWSNSAWTSLKREEVEVDGDRGGQKRRWGEGREGKAPVCARVDWLLAYLSAPSLGRLLLQSLAWTVLGEGEEAATVSKMLCFPCCECKSQWCEWLHFSSIVKTRAQQTSLHAHIDSIQYTVLQSPLECLDQHPVWGSWRRRNPRGWALLS